MPRRYQYAANKEFDKFRKTSNEQIWIQNWQNAYEDGKRVEAELTAELNRTRTALAKMTVERDRLWEQLKLMKTIVNQMYRG